MIKLIQFTVRVRFDLPRIFAFSRRCTVNRGFAVINRIKSDQVDTELQDITPSHNSPLSSLFSDPEKMKIWLVFIDSTEDVQDEMSVAI